MKEKINTIINAISKIIKEIKTSFSNMKKEVIVAISIIFAFFVGVTGTLIALHFFPMEFVTVNKEETEVTVDEDAIDDAINSVYDAVVVVETYSGTTEESSGTGFVYKKDSQYGYVITNNHVISGGNTFYLTFSDGSKVQATVLGSDTYGDIAVLRIPVKYVIQVAEVGDSDDLQIGSTVFAIGAPISSEYSGTTTRGCISGTNRAITVTLSNNAQWVMEVIQTDAAINPGNSGGPLINLKGQVIGVTSSKLVDTNVEGIGFAIPINDVMHYVSYLEQGKEISRPVLGVTLYDLSSQYNYFYSIPNTNTNLTEGAIVGAVTADSSADQAGLEAGDVITAVNGVEVADSAELRYQLYKHSIGDTIKLTYYRNNESHTVSIKLKG